MELAAYLRTEKITQADFAIKVQTTVPTISRIVTGKLKPGRDLAHRIEQATGGQVPLAQWVVDIAA